MASTVPQFRYAICRKHVLRIVAVRAGGARPRPVQMMLAALRDFRAPFSKGQNMAKDRNIPTFDHLSSLNCSLWHGFPVLKLISFCLFYSMIVVNPTLTDKAGFCLIFIFHNFSALTYQFRVLIFLFTLQLGSLRGTSRYHLACPSTNIVL